MRTVVSAVVVFVLLHAGAGGPISGSASSDQAQTPSVVLIITDDVGYGDLGSYGAPDVKTPHIDRLANNGVRLTEFYAAPVCTPTRAALMTGRYQQRVSLERPLANVGAALEAGLTPTGRSLPQLLKNNGYSTALIGKWHLGFKPEFSPNAHGFDHFFGFLSGAIDFYHHTRGDGQSDLFENGKPITERGYMTDLITSRAVRFIEQQKGRPFFLEVAYNAAHWPFQPPDRESLAKPFLQRPTDVPPATRKDYVAMLERADAGVGQIMNALTKANVADDTLVIFTNDNGGEWLSRNAPLFHRKDTLWEGGIRVPAIFHWPARLPRGKTSNQVGIVMDLTASILAATSTPVPHDTRLEGIDLLPILKGETGEIDRTLFWRINIPARQQRAVRHGDWKLLVDGGHVFLFNLKADIGERHDLANERNDLVAKLRGLLTDWEKDVDAEAQAK
jgi:arylsulfatase A-like enzyme